MSSSLGLSSALVDYLAAHNPPEHPALARCRKETAARFPQNVQLQISAEQGAFMQVLARLIHARRAVEVGVFTGYSSTAVALAMVDMHGDDAHLLACDTSEDFTALAKETWAGAGVAHAIDLELGDATATLDHKLAQQLAGTYDFAFIDADKTGYDGYYERCLALLRSGGLLMVDNMLWDGEVADPSANDPATVAIRALADKAKRDTRVHAVLTSVGDGLLLCTKR